MPSEYVRDNYVRAVYVVSFQCTGDGVNRATEFIQHAVPVVYDNHRHLVHGFFLSRHIGPGKDPPYNTVWMNYRIRRDRQLPRCKKIIETDLQPVVAANTPIRADWQNPTDQDEQFRGSDDEAKAFDQPGVFQEERTFVARTGKQWGLEFMPVLWAECEFSTLQAFQTIACPVPWFFHEWSKHIFRNVLLQPE